MIECTADELVIGDRIKIVAEGKGDVWTTGLLTTICTKTDQTDVLKVNTHWVVWSMEPDIPEIKRYQFLTGCRYCRQEWLDEELRSQLYEVSRKRLEYKLQNGISDA